jgi:hypothetical protein
MLLPKKNVPGLERHFQIIFVPRVMLDETHLLFSWERASFGLQNGIRYQKFPSNSHYL